MSDEHPLRSARCPRRLGRTSRKRSLICFNPQKRLWDADWADNLLLWLEARRFMEARAEKKVLIQRAVWSYLHQNVCTWLWEERLPFSRCCLTRPVHRLRLSSQMRETLTALETKATASDAFRRIFWIFWHRGDTSESVNSRWHQVISTLMNHSCTDTV